MEVQAYAGPMNLEQAQMFRKRWKTPPRVTASPTTATTSTSTTQSPTTPRSMNSPLRRFTQNPTTTTPASIDRRGIGARRLFNDAKDLVPTTNNQAKPFAGTPFKLYRDTNVQRLIDTNFDESQLNSSSESVSSLFDSPMYAERHAKLSDTEKGLELIGRELAKEQNIKWREHWSFLGEFLNIASSDGLAKLEKYLQSRDDNVSAAAGTASTAVTTSNVIQTESSLHSVSDALAKLALKDHRINNGTNAVTSLAEPVPPVRRTAELSPSSSASPFSVYLCAEKSWQVYAKRISTTIVMHVDSELFILDTLKAELKRLKALICSYKEDCRFWEVNFQAAHSRFANLIVYYVSHDCDPRQLDKVKMCLQTIQKSIQRQLVVGVDSSAVESITSGLHLQCLLGCLLAYLNNIGK